MFVVLEFNQASHQPSVYGPDIYSTEAEAEEFAQIGRDEIAKVGRCETYEVYALVPADEA